MSRWTSGPSSSLRKCAAAVPPMPAPMMATLGCCLRQATLYQAESSSTSWMHVAGHAALQSMPGTHSERVRLRVQVNQFKLFLQKLLSCFLTGLSCSQHDHSCGMPCNGRLNVCALRIVNAVSAYQ